MPDERIWDEIDLSGRPEASATEDMPLRDADKKDEVDVLNEILVQMALEVDELRHLREEFKTSEKDYSKISFARMDAMQKMANAVAKKRDMIMKGGLDLDAPVFEALITYFLECARDAMTETGHSSEDKDLLFENLYPRLERWQTEIRKRMRLAGSD